MKTLGSRGMRLLIVVATIASSFALTMGPVSAHRNGECWIYAERPYRLMNDGWFHGVGGMDCGRYQHARTRVRVQLLYSYRETGPYDVVATEVVQRRGARWVEADVRIHPCDDDAGHGYYKTKTTARAFNVDGELVHRGKYTSRRKFLSNCVG